MLPWRRWAPWPMCVSQMTVHHLTLSTCCRRVHRLCGNHISVSVVWVDLWDHTPNLTSASHRLPLTENRKEVMSPRCVTNKEEQWRWWRRWRRWEAVGELCGYFPVTSERRHNRSLCDFVWWGGEQRDLRRGRRRLADVTAIIVWKRSDVGMTQTAFCLGSNWRNVRREIFCFGR